MVSFNKNGILKRRERFRHVIAAGFWKYSFSVYV
jgi:hypothetical protein